MPISQKVGAAFNPVPRHGVCKTSVYPLNAATDLVYLVSASTASLFSLSCTRAGGRQML